MNRLHSYFFRTFVDNHQKIMYNNLIKYCEVRMLNITWHDSKLSQTDREKNMGQRGSVLWFTGLSGSGKSTVACETEKILSERGYKTFILDGDNLRFGICSGLGFSEEDRNENIRRIANVAALMAQAGIIVLVSVISPYSGQRENARKIVSAHNMFTEIYVKADVSTCRSRDPKGLYKKADSGEIKNFTGVTAPYEVPECPDLLLDTDKYGVEELALRVADHVCFMQKLPEIAETIAGISVEAGRLIMDIYNRDFEVEYKSDSSPLTEADKKADSYINSQLKILYPEISRMSEESADDRSRLENDLCFITDPLDGTKEFVKKNGEFTVNIGLSHCGKPIAGAVYVPAKDILYYADSIHAYKITSGQKEIIHADEITDKLTVAVSRSHAGDRETAMFEKYKDSIREIIPLGSSLKGCYIAEGKAECYYRFGNVNEWDICAVDAVVRAAGGTLMLMDGSPMKYNKEDPLVTTGFYILNKEENLWTI